MARKRRRNILKQAEGLFHLPEGSICRPLRLECTANRRAVVEGCTRILEYDENRILLETADGTLGFEGTELRVNRMTGGCALVSGHIAAVLFSVTGLDTKENAVCG